MKSLDLFSADGPVEILDISVTNRKGLEYIEKLTYPDKQSFLLDVKTGIMRKGIEVEELVVEDFSDSSLLLPIVKIPTKYSTVTVQAPHPEFIINDTLIASNNSYMPTYFDLETNKAYRCWGRFVPGLLEKYPMVSEATLYRDLFEKILLFLQPYYMEHLEKLGTTKGSHDFGKIYKDPGRNEAVVEGVSSYLRQEFSLAPSARNEDEVFSVTIVAVTNSVRTFIAVPHVTVPVSLRRRGIFKGFMKIIATFMEENGLGNVLCISDSSENGETFRVVDGLEMHGDWTMMGRYDLIREERKDV
jgi:hypothetical protein